LIVKARSLFCYWSVSELGISLSSLAQQLGLSVTAISQSVECGKRIASEDNFSLDDIILLKMSASPLSFILVPLNSINCGYLNILVQYIDIRNLILIIMSNEYL
jgi:hypothetical protein